MNEIKVLLILKNIVQQAMESVPIQDDDGEEHNSYRLDPLALLAVIEREIISREGR